MFNVNKIIIHCSASGFGDRQLIDIWHQERGWNGIGYHFVILNGFVDSSIRFIESSDGKVELGRQSSIEGAHCLGENQNSLGICLIGDKTFTSKQLLTALPNLLLNLMKRHRLSLDHVYGHGELNKDKGCPNINMNIYRDFLRSYFFHQQSLEPYINEHNLGLEL